MSAHMPDPFWPEHNIYRQSPSQQLDPNRVTYFAQTDARNKRVPFGIKAKDRSRHMYVIGKTGMGKSTLLENLAIQDIRNGEGLCFIDPHGKTADLLLDYVPAERIKDVVYFAPFDTQYPISFNVMEDVGEEKRHLVVSGLMSAFKKLWGEESFSDRMQYILQNTLHALLEYPGATLLGVNRMYSDKVFRDKVVANISDLSVKAYWEEEFAGYTERFAAEATPAIQNKIGQFTSNPLIRNVIGQPKSSFDLRQIMDQRKIMIVNLSKGQLGEMNANLLGSMLITKLYLGAMSRADADDGESFPDFHLYVDEFQSFANESFADILSEARKYSLTLTIAHQYMAQMSEPVRDAVMGNVGTMVTFRIGGYDAEVLEKEFQPTFTVEDMVNLGFAQIYLKLMIDGVSSAPFSATTLPPIAKPEVTFREKIVSTSREQFADTREKVEKTIVEWQAEVSAKPGGSASSGNTKKAEPKPDREGPRDSRGGKKQTSRPPAPPIEDSEQKKNPFADIVMSNDGRMHKKEDMKEVVGDDEKRGGATVSLRHMEQQKKPKKGQKPDDKGPSPANMSELKKTLSSLVEKVDANNEASQKRESYDKNEQASAPKKQKSVQMTKDEKSEGPREKGGGSKVLDERKVRRETKIDVGIQQKDEKKKEQKGPHEISRSELERLLRVEDK